jgi:hypothetical protein
LQLSPSHYVYKTAEFTNATEPSASRDRLGSACFRGKPSG